MVEPPGIEPGSDKGIYLAFIAIAGVTGTAPSSLKGISMSTFRWRYHPSQMPSASVGAILIHQMSRFCPRQGFQ